MDSDGLVGAAKQIKGAVKHVVGKAVGDARLESNRYTAAPARTRGATGIHSE
jgi:hypothetical protein